MRLFGHPVHAMLTAFPIGLLALLPLWDLLATLSWLEPAAAVARYTEIAGLGGASLAIVTGLADFAKLRDEPARANAIWHATGAISLVCAFGMALVLRPRDGAPGLLVLGLDAVGALLLGITGWLGGHLVFHHGIGVRDTSAIGPAPPIL